MPCRGAKLGHNAMTSGHVRSGKTCGAFCSPRGAHWSRRYAGPVAPRWADPSREGCAGSVNVKQAPAVPAKYPTLLQFAADQEQEAADVASSLRQMIQTLVRGQQLLRGSSELQLGLQHGATAADAAAGNIAVERDLLSTRTKLIRALTVLRKLLEEHQEQQRVVHTLQQQVAHLQQQQTAVPTAGGLLHGIAAALAGAANRQLQSKQQKLEDELAVQHQTEQQLRKELESKEAQLQDLRHQKSRKALPLQEFKALGAVKPSQMNPAIQQQMQLYPLLATADQQQHIRFEVQLQLESAAQEITLSQQTDMPLAVLASLRHALLDCLIEQLEECRLHRDADMQLAQKHLVDASAPHTFAGSTNHTHSSVAQRLKLTRQPQGLVAGNTSLAEQLAAVTATRQEDLQEDSGQDMQQGTEESDCDVGLWKGTTTWQQRTTVHVAGVSFDQKLRHGAQIVDVTAPEGDVGQARQPEMEQRQLALMSKQHSRLAQLEASITDALQQLRDTRLELQQEGAWAFPTSQGVVDLSVPEAVQLYQQLITLHVQDSLPLGQPMSEGRDIYHEKGSRVAEQRLGLSTAGLAAADAFVEAYLQVKDRDMALHSVGMQLAAIQRQLAELKAVMLTQKSKQCEGIQHHDGEPWILGNPWGAWVGSTKSVMHHQIWDSNIAVDEQELGNKSGSSANESSTGVPLKMSLQSTSGVNTAPASFAIEAHNVQEMHYDLTDSASLLEPTEHEAQAADAVAIPPPSQHAVGVPAGTQPVVTAGDTVDIDNKANSSNTELSSSLQLLQQMTDMIDNRDATILGLQQQLAGLQQQFQAAATEEGQHTCSESSSEEVPTEQPDKLSPTPATNAESQAAANPPTVVFITLPNAEQQQPSCVQPVTPTDAVPQSAVAAQAAAAAATASLKDSGTHADLLGSRLSMAMLMPLVSEVHRAQQAEEALQAARSKVCSVLGLIAGTEMAIMQRQDQALALQKHTWAVDSWRDVLVQIWQLHESEEILAAELAQLQQLEEQQRQQAVDLDVQQHLHLDTCHEQQASVPVGHDSIPEQTAVLPPEPAAAEAIPHQISTTSMPAKRPKQRKWKHGDTGPKQQQQTAELQLPALADIVGWQGDTMTSEAIARLKHRIGELLSQLTERQTDLFRLDRHVGRIAAVMMAGTGEELCVLREQFEVQQQQVERSRRGVCQQLLEMKERYTAPDAWQTDDLEGMTHVEVDTAMMERQS